MKQTCSFGLQWQALKSHWFMLRKSRECVASGFQIFVSCLKCPLYIENLSVCIVGTNWSCKFYVYPAAVTKNFMDFNETSRLSSPKYLPRIQHLSYFIDSNLSGELSSLLVTCLMYPPSVPTMYPYYFSHFCISCFLFQQDESDKRHKEMLEKVREKAFEMTIMRHSTEDHNDAPTHMPYDQKKLCSVCNVMVSDGQGGFIGSGQR